MRLGPPPESREPDVLLALLSATRGLVWSENPTDVVAAVVGLVRALGGSVRPANSAGEDAVPIDLGLGEVDPLLPVAEPASVARLRIETLVPEFVEDARQVLIRMRTNERLHSEAERDELTGLLTPRAMSRRLGSLRDGCLVLVDVDHLQEFNDRHGRPAGDRVLAFLADLITMSLRGADLVGRWEEADILIGMPATTPARAVDRLAELRQVWQRRAPQPSSFSCGVAEVRGSLLAALDGAGAALHRAKADGRDRIEVAP